MRVEFHFIYSNWNVRSFFSTFPVEHFLEINSDDSLWKYFLELSSGKLRSYFINYICYILRYTRLWKSFRTHWLTPGKQIQFHKCLWLYRHYRKNILISFLRQISSWCFIPCFTIYTLRLRNFKKLSSR